MSGIVLTCPLCSSLLPSGELEQHLRVELRYAPLLCRHCPAAFTGMRGLRAHFGPAFPAHPGARLAFLEERDAVVEDRLRALIDAAADGSPVALCRTSCQCCLRRRCRGYSPQGAGDPAIDQVEASQREDEGIREGGSQSETLNRSPPAMQDKSQIAVSVTEEPTIELIEKMEEDKKFVDAVSADDGSEKAGIQCFGEESAIIAYPTVFCRSCKKEVPRPHVKDHAAKHHLKRPLRICRFCQFTSNNYFITQMRRHLNLTHKSQVNDDTCQDLTKSYLPEIKRLAVELFGLK